MAAMRSFATGKMQVSYDTVVARANGTVRVTEFLVEPKDLHLQDLVPAPAPVPG